VSTDRHQDETAELQGVEMCLSLQGGLGNQLFQWAFATSSAAAGADVTLDTVRLRGDRPLALGGLADDFARLHRWHGLLLAGIERTTRPFARAPLRTVVEEDFPFDSTLRSRLRGRVYVLGYFQSFRYFQDVSDFVRTAVRAELGSQLTPAGLALRADLESDPTSVAVHVRRGDYVSNPIAAQHHGVLSPEYYRGALAAMRNRGLTTPVWFSDDPDFVRRELASPNDRVCPVGVARSAGGEIALMAACSGRIIANSSFSWWAGWLGTPGSPVIAPLHWFAAGNREIAQLLPATWIRA